MSKQHELDQAQKELDVEIKTLNARFEKARSEKTLTDEITTNFNKEQTEISVRFYKKIDKINKKYG